jgi:hypothetical protein
MNPAETGREHLITRAFVSLADTLRLIHGLGK